MSESLQPLLTTDRDAVVTDLVAAIDDEVASQKGLSGTALKAGYAAVQKVKPGVVTNAASLMLPDFLTALAPYWDSKPADVPFADHLRTHGDGAAESLLAVSDAQTADANPALTKVYKSLRGKGKNYVVAALPRVGAVIEKHAG